MQNLRDGLGNNIPRVAKEKLGPSWLTLHELGELIRRAGKAAGFIVESESKINLDDGGHVKKIDWVWLDPKSPGDDSRPVVAIEIEGPAVPIDSIKGDLSKFKKLQAPINLIVLFQVDHDRKIKRRPPKKYDLKPKDYVANLVNQANVSVDVEILLDEDLMLPKGIEKLQQKAEKSLEKMDHANNI